MTAHAIALVLASAAASAAPCALFEPDFDQSPAWGVEMNPCADGVVAPLLSTLVTGETRTGILRSAPFAAPERLAFWMAGYSNQHKNHARLIDAATGEELRRADTPRANPAQRLEWDLADLAGRMVRIEIVDGDTGTGWAWISFGRLEPPVLPLPANDGDVPEGWESLPYVSEDIHVSGVPFRRRVLWAADDEGAAATADVPRLRATHLCILGMTNTVDEANPAWGGGDSARAFFPGDDIGRIELTYASGQVDAVPLIVGATVWWREPYRRSPAPFSTDPDAREVLARALRLANAVDGWESDAPYVLTIALRDEPLAALRIADSPDKVGHVVTEGLTFLGVPDDAFPDDPRIERRPCAEDGDPTDLTARAVASEAPYPPAAQDAVANLARLVATFDEDITAETVARTPPDHALADFPGPRIVFSGPPEADILTHVYVDAVSEMRARVESDGMVHESAQGAANYGGFGGYTPGLGAFYGAAYTRNRSPLLLSRLGFQDEAERVIAFFDRWLMYFPDAWPDLQLGGEPVPGHTTVIANKPHVYFDELRLHGWPTRYETRDFGNPENDGHGFQMLAHWRAWTKTGRDPAWVEARWEPIREAADYLLWCVEHPDRSFSEHGLLYSESEGGMQAVTLYCNIPCYLGLLAYIQMADAAGQTEAAARWRAFADRMLTAIEAYFPAQSDPSGDTWDASKAAGWGYDQGVLSPLLFGLDYWGADAMSRMPEPWRDRTRRGYEAACEKLQPDWCAPAGFGYGQGYFTQAALGLDRMQDAAQLVKWLARFCFAPRQPHPYRVPEGITIASDHSQWRRWGDLGNLYQMNEASYTAVLMAGIDDIDPDRVLIMPRIPADWDGVAVQRFPVCTPSGGSPARVLLDMRLSRLPDGAGERLLLRTDRPVDAWDIRLGPIPPTATACRVTLRDAPVDAVLETSGDARWIRFRLDNPDGAREHDLRTHWD